MLMCKLFNFKFDDVKPVRRLVARAEFSPLNDSPDFCLRVTLPVSKVYPLTVLSYTMPFINYSSFLVL